MNQEIESAINEIGNKYAWFGSIGHAETALTELADRVLEIAQKLVYGDQKNHWGTYTPAGETASGMNAGAWNETATFWRKRVEAAEQSGIKFGEFPDHFKATNERAEKAEAELSAARHEMSQCDDIALHRPLDDCISQLQSSRERAEAEVRSLRERIHNDTETFRAEIQRLRKIISGQSKRMKNGLETIDALWESLK